ncbi:MAG: oligopeptide transporter, OPT family [Deltaproteobacteria bacterium]|nr:oligopeptide transporter, OPT family [Deltaproteobacteria bacterium]
MAATEPVTREIIDTTVPGEEFEPYVPSSSRAPEFTLKAVLLGSVITVLFGAANAYLGLKAGLTVAASIPAAVIAAAFFKVVRNGTPLENNIIQTIGSAGVSIASGLIFTIPAFFIWGMDPGQFRIFFIALAGGLLGVLMMIPLRHYLVVKEHHVLPFPEGTACAEVIISSQETAQKARFLFYGFGVALVYQLLCHPHFLGLWQQGPHFEIPGYPKAMVAAEISPELLGAGFIIGPRSSAIIFSGGILGALVLVPLIGVIGQNDPVIAALSAGEIRGKYVRMIGAGAVMAGGILSLLKALPIIISSLTRTVSGLLGDGAKRAESSRRTERDLSPRVVFGATLLFVVGIALLPKSVLAAGPLGALCIALFGFIFVTVSARLTGIVGSSSNPVSGMEIATLVLTYSIFAAFGLTQDTILAKVSILTIGAIVCIAACSSGDTAQDLKTGFLVGGTPYKQQIAMALGVAISAVSMGAVIYLFRDDVLSGTLAAPQANMMAKIIEALLEHSLPWALIFVGVGIAVIAQLLSIPPLAFAVGLYLPLSMSVPIGIGGGICALLRAQSGRQKALRESREERGILYSSGYIAGGAIAGVIITAMVASEGWGPMKAFLNWVRDVSAINPDGYKMTWEPFVAGLGTAGSFVVFLLLVASLYLVGRGKKA